LCSSSAPAGRSAAAELVSGAMQSPAPKPLEQIQIRSRYGAADRAMGHLPDWVAGPGAELLADFEEPVPLGLRFGFLPDEFYESTGSVFVVDPDGQYGGVGVDMSRGLESLLVRIASGIQDFISEFDDSWGDARPPCPGHPHPALAMELDGEAWWTCARTGARLKRIGTAGRMDERSSSRQRRRQARARRSSH
jgi:hypothetical protein